MCLLSCSVTRSTPPAHILACGLGEFAKQHSHISNTIKSIIFLTLLNQIQSNHTRRNSEAKKCQVVYFVSKCLDFTEKID